MVKTIDGVNTYTSTQGNLKLYFSNMRNKKKYEKMVLDFVPSNQEFLQHHYDIDFVKINSFFYIILYKKIEHNIFKILVQDRFGKPAYFINKDFGISINLMNYKEKADVNQMG